MWNIEMNDNLIISNLCGWLADNGQLFLFHTLLNIIYRRVIYFLIYLINKKHIPYIKYSSKEHPNCLILFHGPFSMNHCLIFNPVFVWNPKSILRGGLVRWGQKPFWAFQANLDKHAFSWTACKYTNDS